jgi:uncharacterized protein with GYD domain
VAFFVTLGRFTDQGLRNIKDYPSLSTAVGQTNVVKGDLFVTQGRYDLVGVIECASQEDALQLVAQNSAQGNVRWETMPAVTIERFGELMAASGGEASQPNVRLIPDEEKSVRGGWQTS